MKRTGDDVLRAELRASVDAAQAAINQLIAAAAGEKSVQDDNEGSFTFEIMHKLQHISTLCQAAAVVLQANLCPHKQEQERSILPLFFGSKPS